MIDGKVAYLMSRFPHLPETFILREMTEMQRQGWQIGLYPLIRQKQAVVHAQAHPWLEKAVYTPALSTAMLSSNLRMLRRRTMAYLRMWFQALRENARDVNFLARTVILLPKAAYLAERMQQDGVAHIHAHYATHPALVAWAIHLLTGIPYSLTVHAHDIFVRQTMLATKLREAEFIVAISNYNREFLAQRVGEWVREKIHVVHCGIEPEMYTPAAEASGEYFEILNIGSLQPYKGHPDLVEACAIMKKHGIPFRCRIIGGGSQEGLRQLITARGLQAEVELLGPLDQSEVAAWLAKAGCYVQPSVITASGKMEGIPVAIMEALAAERPVVATEISGVPELVQPGKTGYLTPPGNPQALARALETVYHHPQQARALAAAGRNLVLEQFNLRTNVEQLGNLIRTYSEAQAHVADEASWATSLS